MRVQTNDGQEVAHEDINRIGQLSEKVLNERFIHYLTDKQLSGFFQDSFFVDFVDASNVSVRAGLGIQEDNTQVSPETTKRVLYRAAAQTLALTAPDGTNPRKDIVVIKHNRVTTVSASRQVKDFVTEVVAPQSVVTETDWNSLLQVVTGTPGGSPAEPAVPSGYLKIAVVDVPAATGPTSQANITDSRTVMPILENTKIDTSLFVSVPTKAVGTKLKTTLSELDALAGASAQVGLIFNKIVGSAPGCTHASLTIALGSLLAGDRILVTESQAPVAAYAINVANVEIHTKAGAIISKGGAQTTCFDVQAGGSGFNYHGGKISGFNGGTDKGFAFNASAESCSVWGTRFLNVDTPIDSSLVDVAQFGNIEE